MRWWLPGLLDSRPTHSRRLRTPRVGVNVSQTADYENEPSAAAIAKAALRLVTLRDRWLNPPEWVYELVPGYPQGPPCFARAHRSPSSRSAR